MGTADASETLHDRWLLFGRTGRADILAGVAKPRPVALRARFYVLAAVPRAYDTRWFDVSFTDWNRQTSLVALGEEALVAGDLETAEREFAELERVARESDVHPVALVDALIGLGDVARARDRVDEAAAHYAEAYRLAETHGLDFGRLRALVPWTVLERRTRSASGLLPTLDLCEELARSLGDDVYLGNSLVVRAEVLTVAGDLPGALVAADQAAALHGGHPAALAGLYVRLADTCRMAQDLPGLRSAVLRALAVLRSVDLPVERVEVLDLLATLRLAEGQWDSGRVAAEAAVAEAVRVGYGRGAAHAQMTLSQLERKAGRLREALVHRREATHYFAGRADSRGSLAYCLVESAELLQALGRHDEAVSDVNGALSALESLRCAQPSPAAQQEYRRRFAQVYRRGLRLACAIDDPVLFVTVFEGLWGRRLPGLTESGVHLENDALLLAHLLAQAKLTGAATTETGRARTVRLLGRTALSGALPGMVDDATNAAIAALATPYDPESARAHLAAIPPGTAALLLAPLPERSSRFVSLLVDPEGQVNCGEYEMPEATRASLNGGLSDLGAGTVDDLAPLTSLLPESLARVPAGTPLLIVPLEEFWPLPWTAIPLGETLVLGERHPIRLCPSLALAAAARSRDLPSGRDVRTWIGPGVRAHHLTWLPATRCDNAAEALRRVTNGAPHDDVVVVCHGTPLGGIGHVLDLGDLNHLTPHLAMSAQAPGRVALIACWGAHVPGDSTGDPLNVATVLLARGAVTVLATSAELSDDTLGAAFVESLLNKPEYTDWSIALRDTIERRLIAPEYRRRTRRWAPLRVLGAW